MDGSMSNVIQRFPLNGRIVLVFGYGDPGNGLELGAQVLYAAVAHHVGDFTQGEFSVINQLLDLLDLVQDDKFFKGCLFVFCK